MAWQFTMEFSGITLLHLKKVADGYKGTAYCSEGLTGSHKPYLYVPMEGLRGPQTYSAKKLRKGFGLRVIAAPGGRYLLEVALKDSVVTFGNTLAPRAVDGIPANVVGGVDWNDLQHSADIRALAQKGNPARVIDPTRASVRVVLPTGALISLPAPPPGKPEKVYTLTTQETGKSEVPVSKQPVADRHAMLLDCTAKRTLIIVKKTSGKELRLSFGPPDETSAMSIAFSSNCAEGTGTDEELSEYTPLLSPRKLKLRMKGTLATDDHACISGLWID